MAQTVSTTTNSASPIDVKIIVNDGRSYIIEKFDIGLTTSQFIEDINRITNLNISFNIYEMRCVFHLSFFFPFYLFCGCCCKTTKTVHKMKMKHRDTKHIHTTNTDVTVMAH